MLHATETGLRSALVLLHRSVPYLAKKLFVEISILLVKLDFISIFFISKKKQNVSGQEQKHLSPLKT